MQLIKKRFFKNVVILLLATLTVYIFKLNSEVKAEFSNPPKLPSNVNQIEYAIDEYPKDLINMLLLVEEAQDNCKGMQNQLIVL